MVGVFDGDRDGVLVGVTEGDRDGALDGEREGELEGAGTVGIDEGLAEGAFSDALGSTHVGKGPAQITPFNNAPQVDAQQSPSS